jgi:hypothetical protein
MERRTFLKGAFYSIVATVGAMVPFGRRDGVESLSLVEDAHGQAGDSLPDNCKNRTKGLTRCREHKGACEGTHHACNAHKGRCQAQVQCKVKGHIKGLPGG